MYYSFSFTNNGGVDNSTCDMTIDGTYWTTPLNADNYAGFAWFYSETGNAVRGAYALGD